MTTKVTRAAAKRQKHKRAETTTLDNEDLAAAVSIMSRNSQRDDMKSTLEKKKRGYETDSSSSEDSSVELVNVRKRRRYGRDKNLNNVLNKLSNQLDRLGTVVSNAVSNAVQEDRKQIVAELRTVVQDDREKITTKLEEISEKIDKQPPRHIVENGKMTVQSDMTYSAPSIKSNKLMQSSINKNLTNMAKTAFLSEHKFLLEDTAEKLVKKTIDTIGLTRPPNIPDDQFLRECCEEAQKVFSGQRHQVQSNMRNKFMSKYKYIWKIILWLYRNILTMNSILRYTCTQATRNTQWRRLIHKHAKNTIELSLRHSQVLSD